MSATATLAEQHDWRIVAPWYRWARIDGVEPERAAEADRPVIQKFATTDFVRDFLRDPQRSVVYDGTDEVQRLEDAGTLPDGRQLTLSGKRLVPSGTRKLFLPAHQRFYVVAVGLHCDRPGFPKVDPAAVTEIGFVIRRQRLDVPDDEEQVAAKLLHEVAAARAVAQISHRFDVAKRHARLLHPFSSRARGRVAAPGAAAINAARELELARRRLREWADAAGVEQRTEGWVPTGEGSFGAWVPLPDAPLEVVERSYPLRALRSDPDDPEHAALDGTIFYAALPTGSDEVGADGSNRFNERDSYEIVAFARRDDGPCPGVPIWSRPSLAFKLASFYDPHGSSQRPIEIRLPDFAELAASTALPSVKMSAPDASSLEFPKNGAFPEQGRTGGGEEICFFSIPLITIVALFLLNIVLPIVVFVFGLWWMLKLKFCIPPSIDLQLGLEAELGITPPEFEFAAELGIDIETQGVTDLLTAHFNDVPVPPWPLPIDPPEYQIGDELTAPAQNLSNQALLDVLLDQGLGSVTGGAPDFTTEFTYHERVEREQVVHP